MESAMQRASGEQGKEAPVNNETIEGVLDAKNF